MASEFGNAVFGYTIGSGGFLTGIPGSPFAAGNAPYAVTVDPTGQFVYAVNSSDNTVSAYTIGAGGALTPVSASPFATGTGPRSVAVDPTGKFVYVLNGGSATVSGYSIGSGGTLTALAGSPFAENGGLPSALAITPFVPFALFSSTLDIESDHSSFQLGRSFTLGANTNGITPPTENLTLQIGTFSVTIPSGSFKQKKTGDFVFNGTINSVGLSVKIVPLGNNMFTFDAKGSGVDLGSPAVPITVILTIGIDSGTTTLTHYKK